MREHFARAAATYDRAAVLADETGRRMLERLTYVKLTPRVLLDVGCATGAGITALMQRYPKALPLAIDYAYPMLLAACARRVGLLRRRPRAVQADVHALPLADGSVHLIWSNQMLHWLDDPRPAFAELRRVLAPGGLFCFTMFGPDTLQELRAAGAAPRAFLDMHDIGDQLVACGFASPVLDTERIVLSYRSARDFLRDQRHLGVRDGLLGSLPWRRWRQVLANWQRSDGRLPASFEIVQGHAWSSESTGEKSSICDTARPLRFMPRAACLF